MIPVQGWRPFAPWRGRAGETRGSVFWSGPKVVGEVRQTRGSRAVEALRRDTGTVASLGTFRTLALARAAVENTLPR